MSKFDSNMGSLKIRLLGISYLSKVKRSNRIRSRGGGGGLEYI